MLCAAKGGFVDVVRALHAGGADMDIRSTRGSTALHTAVLARSIPTVQTLLECGCSTDAVDGSGQTPHTLALSLQLTTIANMLNQPSSNT